MWSYAHPGAIELAERLADLAPGDLERVFHDRRQQAVESAWKLARQYFQAIGQPAKQGDRARHRVPRHDHRRAVDHRLSPLHTPCEPLVPGAPRAEHEPSRWPEERDPLGGGGDRAPSINSRARSVAAVFLEPVQNKGGCFRPTDGYFQRVR